MSTHRMGTLAPAKRTWWLLNGLLGLASGLLILAIAALSYSVWRPLPSRRRAGRDGRLLLFVCSGNTCRSAMAEAIARTELPDRWRVASAGVAAAPGELMPMAAVTALTELGVHANGHRSRQLTREMIAEADLVYCITSAHRDAVLALAPRAASKIVRLDPEGDIADPHGQSVDEYLHCAERLRYVISQRLVEVSAVSPPR